MVACCHTAVVLACFTCITGLAHAQGRSSDYPTRPIRVIIGIAPGGGLDTITRVASQKLSERIGQTAVVDNRPGGGTVLASDLVQAAPPDGYTLLCASETIMLNGVLKRTKYDVRTAFVPIAPISSQPYILVVNPSVPVTTVKDLIAYAKARPRALSFGTPGIGTMIHIGWERLIAMTKIDVVHVPYKGGAPAVIDLMSGEIQMVITTTITAGPHMKSGKLKAIAMTGPKRLAILPDLPTISESGLPGFELTNSYAFFAPAGTPLAIVMKLNAALIQVMNAPETRKVLANDGAEAAAPQTPGEFKARFAREYVELEKTIAGANIKLQ